MDRFYLDNAALYQTLVRNLNSTIPASQTTQEMPTEAINPDMVVTARIRPLLDEDIDAGFPCAVYPRSGQAGVVDIHDLYNHPRGRPILKVCELTLHSICPFGDTNNIVCLNTYSPPNTG